MVGFQLAAAIHKSLYLWFCVSLLATFENCFLNRIGSYKCLVSSAVQRFVLILKNNR